VTVVTSVSGSTSYERPFGANAPWNIPVDRLQVDPNSANLSRLLWNNAPDRPGNFNMSFVDYTYPVYDARDATGWYTVRTTWNTKINGTQIPWNPAWKGAPGSDGQVIIIDPATGREWDLWQVSFDGSTVRATNGSLVPGNYATYEGGNSSSRGVGIQYLAMLVRPEEIAQGRIEHALSMPIRNPDGTRYVAPATKLEHATGQTGIPEGTRFALNVSDADIARWLDSLPDNLPAETVRSARIIAEALRDYGWFITDTAGSAHFQFEANTTAASDWAKLGLTPNSAGSPDLPRDLLDGLLTQDKIYAIRPSDQYPGSAYSKKSSADATLGSADSHLALEGTANINGTGNAGNNDIRGNSGNNVLKGLAGNDWLAGGLGNDTLVGGTGNDTLDGGVGNDIFIFAKGDGKDVIRDFEPGAGTGDVLQLDGFGFTSFDQVKAAMQQNGAHVLLNLGGSDSITFEYLKVADFAANDFRFGSTTPPPPTNPPENPPENPGPAPTQPTLFTLPESGAPTKFINGTSRNDTLNGTSGNDTLGGGAGDDRMTGGRGDDTYYVSQTNDKVVEYSGQGIDTVETWAGKYTLAANVENLIAQGDWAHNLTGNGINNRITLSSGGDTVNAGAGNDIIIAGSGADRMTGGSGKDIFVLGAGTAPDVITDFVSRTDILDMRALTKGYTGTNPFADGVISVSQSNAGAVISFDKDGSAGAAAAAPVVTLSGVMASTLLHQDIAWS
jgi:Ca2+-binding RTX toxin-like protein